MTTLGYVHHSGRYDRTPQQLGTSLVSQAQQPGVSLIGVTEVANQHRKAGARDWLATIGWAWADDPDSECALAYDTASWQLLDVREVQVTKVRTWSTQGRLRAPFRVLLVSLRNREDHLTYTVSVGHTPSAVQAGKRWRRNNRARQHRDGLRGWHQALRRYGKTHPAPGGRIVSMDANLDLRLEVWRRYLRRCFPGLTLVRDPRMVGTHAGGRVIDAVLVSRKLQARKWWRGRRVRVVDAKDSDHRSVITRLARKLVRR